MRLTSALLLFPTTLLAACGGDDTPPGGDVDAAPPTSSIDVIAKRAAIKVGRVAGGPWQQLTTDASGKAAFAATGPFEVAGVCADDGGQVYGFAGGLEDDDRDGQAYDIGCGDVPFGRITLTNTGEGTVNVSTGFGSAAVTAGAPRPLEVALGTRDVFIVDRVNHRVAIRRNVTFTAGMNLNVDLTGAEAMVQHPVTLEPATATATSVAYSATGTRVELGRREAVAWSLPPALTLATDSHRVTLLDIDPALPRRRSHTVALDPAATAPLSISLPPQITSATLTWTQAPAATYVATGTWDSVDLLGYPDDADLAPLWLYSRYPHAAASPGAIAAPDLSALAGWMADWAVPTTEPYILSLSLRRSLPDGSFESVQWDHVDTSTAAAARLAPARAERIERALQRVEARR